MPPAGCPAIGSALTFRQDAATFRRVGPHVPRRHRQIEVTVEPNFMPKRSSVEKREYFWSYTIVITNTGAETVQLRTRHWIITDATGRQENVRGKGVVGEQPVLAPGERFEYTSGVPLPTASGFMTGRYQMVSESASSSRSTCRCSRSTARQQAGVELDFGAQRCSTTSRRTPS